MWASIIYEYLNFWVIDASRIFENCVFADFVIRDQFRSLKLPQKGKIINK